MEKSFSHAKDVKLSKTQSSYIENTKVNLCLAGNTNSFSTPDVMSILQQLSLKKNIILTFWKPSATL